MKQHEKPNAGGFSMSRKQVCNADVAMKGGDKVRMMRHTADGSGIQSNLGGIGRFALSVALVVSACGGGGASASPTLPASGPTSTAATVGPGEEATLNVSWGGGALHDNYLKAVVEPFMAENPNITVNLLEASNSAEQLGQLRAERASPSLDVVIMDITVAQVAYGEDLFQGLDPSKVPNVADLDPQAQFPDGQGAGVTFDAFVLNYDPTKVSPAPTSWKELLDPKWNNQSAGWPPPDLEGIFLTVAVNTALGHDYKATIDPALDALRAASANFQTWNPTPDTYPMIVDGTLSLAPGYNARAQLSADENPGRIATAYPSEGIVFQINRINLVAGSKNADAAQAFIDYALSPEAQAAFAQAMYYAPTNTKAKTLLPTDVLDRTATAEGLEVITLDWPFIIQNRDAWEQAFKEKVLSQ
jgi:putative spermidine/putrescine transport system substrate-binding protein